MIYATHLEEENTKQYLVWLILSQHPSSVPPLTDSPITALDRGKYSPPRERSAPFLGGVLPSQGGSAPFLGREVLWSPGGIS